MNPERDPVLDALFREAEQPLADEAFTDGIVTGMKRRRRRVLAVRLAVVAAIVLLELLLESPLQQSLGALAEVLGTPLVAIDDGWLAFLLAPVNSIAGLVGLVLLGIHYLYRRIVY